MFKLTTQNIVYIIVAALVIYYLFPGILGSFGLSEGFDGEMGHAGSGLQNGPSCGGGEGCDCGPYSGAIKNDEIENFSSCYRRKQIYLNSCDPDTPTVHGDINLEKRWGKLYINIQANLPFALGGVYNTMWGSYQAFLVDTKTKRSINLGSLVRHGDRFYKLSTELLGEYSNYDEIWVYRQTEDYNPKLIGRAKIHSSQCSSL